MKTIGAACVIGLANVATTTHAHLSLEAGPFTAPLRAYDHFANDRSKATCEEAFKLNGSTYNVSALHVRFNTFLCVAPCAAVSRKLVFMLRSRSRSVIPRVHALCAMLCATFLAG